MQGYSTCMSPQETGQEMELSRREDFPIDSFRHMERRLHTLRKYFLDTSASNAERRDTDPQRYTVTCQDIDAAVEEFRKMSPQERLELLGIPSLTIPPADQQ